MNIVCKWLCVGINPAARPGKGKAQIQHSLQRLISAFILFFCTSLAASAASFELPPLMQPASSEHHPGKVIWVDLVTSDLDGAKRFYSSLFGWTYKDVNAGELNYAIALLDGRPVAGLFSRQPPRDESKRPAWLTFIAVPDVDATTQLSVKNGARILFQPRTYPKRGRQAVFADPQGAVFAVLASASGDPPDVLALPGEWIWSSLITTDPDNDAAFYQTLFGYTVFPQPADDGQEHLLLATDDSARASINPLPANAPKQRPHWLNFVRVTDAVATAAQVKMLGGRVLVEPRPDRHGGQVAVVADPAGAVFGLLEWVDSDNKEVAK
ncbi:MAG: VOC family protein [Pseudomonadota bacterium]